MNKSKNESVGQGLWKVCSIARAPIWEEKSECLINNMERRVVR